MKTCDIDGIAWHLDDEGLIQILKALPLSQEKRRGYGVYPYGGGKVFIKSFRERGIAGLVRNRVLPRGKKEYQAGMRLLASGIPTPKPLGYGISKEGSYIINEWLPGESLAAHLKTEDRRPLIRSLALLLKALKDHRVRHNDLHLDNVLVVEGTLTLIDLHKMKVKRPFRKADEVSNLSHALVSLYADMDEEVKESFFSAYGNREVRPRVERAIGGLTTRWFKKKMDRAFDGTSRITITGNRLYVAGMENRASAGLVETIKRDKKVLVERYGDHIRKIYRDKRRLKRAWKAHVVFLYMDLPAIPEAYYCALPSSGEAGYVAMEDLKGKGEELDRYLDRHYDTMSYADRKGFIDGLALFFEGLLKWGIVHNDLKGCNVFVTGDSGFRLLDVEDFTFGSLHSEHIKKMFLQLNTTLPKRIVMRDRVRFFLRITSFLTVDRRALFRTLLYKSAGSEIVYVGKSGLMRESW